ncbi:hypothetical protein ACFQVC_21540 [Streptomyces monticola]|uniref:Uncharacterized protein n=1 Tax=Streptomyces monticola TaxID=2666263 RepID=A0ABW2JNC3_9ACTN
MTQGPRRLNAIEISPEYIGSYIEFRTVCRQEYVDQGFGEFGAPVTIKGFLLAVSRGMSMARAYTRVIVAVAAPNGLGPIRVTSTLGSHVTVTLSELG